MGAYRPRQSSWRRQPLLAGCLIRDCRKEAACDTTPCKRGTRLPLLYRSAGLHARSLRTSDVRDIEAGKPEE